MMILTFVQLLAVINWAIQLNSPILLKLNWLS